MILETVYEIILDCIIAVLDIVNFEFVFTMPDWAAHTTSMFLKCLAFFPFEIWSILISNIMFWVGVHFVWAIIEWIYMKIPGVS